MEERILAPIGLVMGVITDYTKRIRVESEFGFNHQQVRQEGLFKKIHSPIQGRSPPLLTG